MIKNYNFLITAFSYIFFVSLPLSFSQKLDLTAINNKQFNKGALFTAVTVPENIKLVLNSIQNELSEKLGKNFTPNSLNNLHITLQELNIQDANSETVIDKIDPALKKSVKNCKKFNSNGHTRFIEISSKGNVKLRFKSKKLASLANTIKKNLDKIRIHKYRHDAPNKLHITLGTIPHNTEKIDPNKIDLRTLDKVDFPISSVVLFKSNSPQIPRAYHQIGLYQLQ